MAPAPLTALSAPIPGSASGFGPIPGLGALGDPTLVAGRRLRGQSFVGVAVDYSDALEGIADLGGLMELAPGGLEGFASRLVREIQTFTPHGPARDRSMMHTVTNAGAFQAQGIPEGEIPGVEVPAFQEPQPGSAEFGPFRQEVNRTFDDLARKNRQLRSDAGLASREFAKVERDVMQKLQRRHERAQTATVRRRRSRYGGETSGSLIGSITVDAHVSSGRASLRAYSTNYYAWFVENGFMQTTVPVPIHPALGNPYRTIYSLPIDRLGRYEKFQQILADRQNRYDQSRENGNPHPGFVNAGNWEGMISFQRRRSPVWQEGHHMFERGFAAFVTAELPTYEHEIRRSVARVWEDRQSPAAAYHASFRGGGGAWRDRATGRFTRRPGG